MSVIRISFTVIEETEEQSGVSIDFDGLMKSGLMTEELTTGEAIMRGLFEMAIDGLREQRSIKQRRAEIEKRDSEAPKRADIDCIGCRFDVKDERAYRLGEGFIRCSVCKRFCQPIFDKDDVLLSPLGSDPQT